MWQLGCQVNELLTADTHTSGKWQVASGGGGAGASLKLQQGLEGATGTGTRKTKRQNQEINNYYDVAAHPKRDSLQPQEPGPRLGVLAAKSRNGETGEAEDGGGARGEGRGARVVLAIKFDKRITTIPRVGGARNRKKSPRREGEVRLLTSATIL